MPINIENLKTELQKLINQQKSVDNSFDAMPEPFLRGVHHGYLEGLIHAMRVLIDAEYKEITNA